MAQTYPEWKRLVDLLEIVSSQGFDRLEADEIIEFGKLYRRAAAELSFHRTHEADPLRVAFLNDLLGRCYPYVYTAPRTPWPSAARFFAADFPRAVRRHFGWILLATMLSLIPAAIGYWLTWTDRAIAYQVLPTRLLHGIAEQIDRHHASDDWLKAQDRPMAASFIMTNNIQVSIFGFAGGMTAGLVTIYLLITNGLMLGITAAGVAADGPSTAMSFWGFVAPHGILELPAIFIACGAGLLLGYALINPGTLPRRIALRRAGAEALKLMLGVAAMLVVAGLIEGFFSPMVINEAIKFTVAMSLGILMVSYFLLAGRGPATDARTAQHPFGELMTPLPPV
ncbi:MAG TPA: stage II sporulation protein M [Armatimonadota bacterium]|nr:stage II sporulation protein M [Armatimonadota bacterium]HOS42288.1 stage II sporulation protein M [Armatimonadota bacterium]